MKENQETDMFIVRKETPIHHGFEFFVELLDDGSYGLFARLNTSVYLVVQKATNQQFCGYRYGYVARMANYFNQSGIASLGMKIKISPVQQLKDQLEFQQN